MKIGSGDKVMISYASSDLLLFFLSSFRLPPLPLSPLSLSLS
jgi:hypothetical protein